MNKKFGGKTMDMKNKLKELLDNAAVDWNYDITIEPEETINGQHFKERCYIEIGQYSPAGEDFSMIIDFNKENPVKSFLKNLEEYAEDFDVDEHVELWLPSRGEGGCPSSISELLEDAKEIKNMIEALLDGLKNYVGKKTDKE